MQNIRWAVLGAGVIANEMAVALKKNGRNIDAVGNRTHEKAVAFAEKYGIKKVYDNYNDMFATVYKGNIIKNLIMDCQSYTKYRPNETTGGIFVSWRRKEELPTGA